jgi:Fe-S cluster assembly iron-binding protein IscA
LDSDKEYLNDTLIDYKKDGLSSKIVFENPQAFNHCGCGESFSIRK